MEKPLVSEGSTSFDGKTQKRWLMTFLLFWKTLKTSDGVYFGRTLRMQPFLRVVGRLTDFTKKNSNEGDGKTAHV